MKKMMFGAMMAGLLGLAGTHATAAQVVAGDGWWSSDYGLEYERSDEREYPRQNERGYQDGYYDDGYRGDAYVDDHRRDERRIAASYEAGPVDVYRSRGGRIDVRGRERVRGTARVGVRLPGRVVVTASPSRRVRGRHAPAFYWSDANWNVRFSERYVGYGYRASLRDIVGKKTFKRLKRHRDRLHVRGALTYRWVDLGRRGTMLQVRAGRIPIAELIDFGHDCYVDVVRLNQSAW